jgi:hypothetical protein
MTIQAINGRCSMPMVTNRTPNFTKVGLVRIAVRKILRGRLGNQLLKWAMAFQTPLVVNGVLRLWQPFTMTASAGDILPSMERIEIG